MMKEVSRILGLRAAFERKRQKREKEERKEKLHFYEPEPKLKLFAY